MRTIKYIMMTLVGGLTLLSSCDSMEDTYKGFLEGGEIVYRAKAKELTAESGRNRAKLHWYLEFPTHVVKCEIRDGQTVLATLPVAYQDSVGMGYTLENLEEKTYTFSVYSFDEQGNSSIKTDVIVEVYGDRYISSLRTERSIEGVLRKVDSPSTVLVSFPANGSSKLIGTDLFYQTTSGEKKSVRVLPAMNQVELTDVAADSYFNLQDFWKPMATAIDEFEAPVKEYAVSKIPNGAARVVNSAYKLDESTVVVVLSSAASNVRRTVISYGNKEVTVLPGESSVTLSDVPSDAVLTVSTIVSVGTPAIEYMAPVQKQETSALLKKVAMADWTVTGFSSSQSSEGSVSYTFDDNLATYWHTQYSPSQPKYPHYIAIDMKASHLVKGVAVARRNGNNNIAARMRLEVSNDGENWSSAGEFSPNNSINGLQIFKLANPTEGRYFKLTGLSSSTSNTYMCISEINIYE